MLLASLLLLAVPPVLPADTIACRGPRGAVPAVREAALLADVAALAHDSMEGRALGSAGGARARRYLAERVRQIGLDSVGPLVRPFPAPSRADSGRTGANVVALVRGRDAAAPYLVLTAHYDHLGVRDGRVYNGADDNASGTAALLAAAEHFRRHPPRHPIVFAWLDGEERGLRGAEAFVASPPVPLDRIAIDVNLDMVGRSERREVYVTGPAHRPWLLPYVERAACGTGVTLVAGHDKGDARGDDWTGQSDHYRFHAAGIPFLYLGVEDHPDYHRPTDDVARIDPAVLSGATRAAIALVEALDADLDAVLRHR